MSKNSLKITKVKKIVNSSREVLLKNIYNNLESLSDDDITKIHNSVLGKDIDNKKTVKVSKAKKVVKTVKVSKKKVYQKKRKKPNAEKKIEIAFHIINGVYKALEQNEIDTLIDFNIWREDVISDKVSEYLDNEGYDYAFNEGMPKGACAWGKKKVLDNYSISFIKYLIRWAYDDKYEIISKPLHRNVKLATSYIIVKKI
jgi:hypothetical protein